MSDAATRGVGGDRQLWDPATVEFVACPVCCRGWIYNRNAEARGAICGDYDCPGKVVAHPDQAAMGALLLLSGASVVRETLDEWMKVRRRG
jgi:hypothetical protein